MADLIVFDSPAATGTSYNLSGLSAQPEAAGPTALERTDATAAATVTDGPAHIAGGERLPISGWCDGIQSTLKLGYTDCLPLVAAYTAAGAADGRTPTSLVGLVEHIGLYTALGHPGADDIADTTGLPVEYVDFPDLSALPTIIADRIGSVRAAAEHTLITRLTETKPGHNWVVDGSLAHTGADTGLIGVVKTHGVRYLDDETDLYRLPAGWRSSVFTFTHPRRTEEDTAPTVFSAYVRLHHRPDSAWDAGLIRVETIDPDLLDAACATVTAAAQPATAHTTDRRWDRHLDPIARCEDLLRSRRPIIFGR